MQHDFFDSWHIDVGRNWSGGGFSTKMQSSSQAARKYLMMAKSLFSKKEHEDWVLSNGQCRYRPVKKL
jgi:hypothetical protein